MPQDTSRDDFDWVSAQAACTAETMFPRLLAGARRDVERRNALADPEYAEWEVRKLALDQLFFEDIEE